MNEESGQGQGQGQAKDPSGEKPPPASGSAPPALVSLSAAEFERLRAMERDYQRQLAEAQREREEANQERLRVLAEKEGAKAALEAQRADYGKRLQDAEARHAALQGRIAEEKRAAVISSALQGRRFVGATEDERAAAAADLRRLLADDFEAAPDASGEIVVREKRTGRIAAEVLRERLASPRYAYFLAPERAGGGAGADATRTPAPTKTEGLNDLQKRILAWHEQSSQYPGIGLAPRPRKG